MLEIDRLNISYGDVQVLWNVTMRVARGEIVAVIGPNGAGKSTLLKTIVNLIRPKKGEGGSVLYRGRPILRISPEETVRLGIAAVPEGARVFAEMTVLDNLRMGSYIEAARARRQETLVEVFSLFPFLEERAQQKAGTLSGGERQMLALGRALMSRPELLLLDEPSLGLQPLLVEKTFAAVGEINRRGVAVLLVEQNVHQSLRISHRGYVLENGRIALEGRGQDLLVNPHIKDFYLAV